MHIDRYKNDDGFYHADDGSDWDTSKSFIQGHIFNFCGCGRPDDNLIFVRDGLNHINQKGPDKSDERFLWYKDVHEPERLAIFGNEASAYFFFYWANSVGLTAHGGSIPGWLTDEGRELLDDLNEYLAVHEESAHD